MEKTGRQRIKPSLPDGKQMDEQLCVCVCTLLYIFFHVIDLANHSELKPVPKGSTQGWEQVGWCQQKPC